MKDKNAAKKEKAIELLKEMDIYTPYIKGFEEKGLVCFFENYGGFWIDQDPELYAKLKELEKKYSCLVYAVTHEYTEFGECYSFLLVTDYSRNGRRSYGAKATNTLRSPMSGTKTTIGAASSAASWCVASAAVSRELHNEPQAMLRLQSMLQGARQKTICPLLPDLYP